jgi:hypothetical protein
VAMGLAFQNSRVRMCMRGEACALCTCAELMPTGAVPSIVPDMILESFDFLADAGIRAKSFPQ